MSESLQRGMELAPCFATQECISPHCMVLCSHVSCLVGTYLMYCSDLLYFFARYLAEALLGILTKDNSLLYLVMLHGVSHTQKLLSCSTKKSGEEKNTTKLDRMCVCVIHAARI